VEVVAGPRPLVGAKFDTCFCSAFSLWRCRPSIERRKLLIAWKGVFVSATISSALLIGEFFYRLQIYKDEIAAGGDSNLYLRSGGLLHHWMVYGTVEILVVAGIIGFWLAYETQRRRLLPIIAINAVAIILSLTRMTWVTCLLVVGIALVWTRSRWIWAMPLLPDCPLRDRTGGGSVACRELC
jgi:hypothetical protein